MNSRVLNIMVLFLESIKISDILIILICFFFFFSNLPQNPIQTIESIIIIIPDFFFHWYGEIMLKVIIINKV